MVVHGDSFIMKLSGTRKVYSFILCKINAILTSINLLNYKIMPTRVYNFHNTLLTNNKIIFKTFGRCICLNVSYRKFMRIKYNTKSLACVTHMLSRYVSVTFSWTDILM